MIWSDATISRFAQEAENQIAMSVKCIVKRLSIAIIAKTAIYTLPIEAISIRRVTWKGKKLEAIGTKTFEDYRFTSPLGQSLPQGTPYCYLFASFGEDNIRLYPNPSISIAANAGDLYNASVIANSFIVEYWALPDFNSNTQRVPAWIRRRLVKAYVLYKCFNQEGPGYDEVGAKYYKALYQGGMEKFENIHNRVFFSKPSSLGDSQSKVNLQRPVLKYKYLGF